MDRACEAEQKQAKEQATRHYPNAFDSAVLAGCAGMEQPRPDSALALEAAASVATILDFFVRPYALQSRPLSRSEKIAALHAAIAAYERLW